MSPSPFLSPNRIACTKGKSSHGSHPKWKQSGDDLVSLTSLSLISTNLFLNNYIKCLFLLEKRSCTLPKLIKALALSKL